MDNGHDKIEAVFPQTIELPEYNDGVTRPNSFPDIQPDVSFGMGSWSETQYDPTPDGEAMGVFVQKDEGGLR